MVASEPMSSMPRHFHSARSVGLTKQTATRNDPRPTVVCQALLNLIDLQYPGTLSDHGDGVFGWRTADGAMLLLRRAEEFPL
jgi:hypothetical protein